MKKLLMSAMVMMGLMGYTFAQTTPAKEVKKVAPKTTVAAKATVKVAPTPTLAEKTTTKKVNAVEQKAAPVAASATKIKKDGTPDKRFKANAQLKKDGTVDKRFKENKKG